MELRVLGLKQSKLKRSVLSKTGQFKQFSTVEKLAYNNAEEYEFQGQKFDYRKKQIDDFLESSFILPAKTKTDKNKVQLFTELENSFKKNDAFLAMNYIISLPRMNELDPKVSQKIITDFFQKMANEKSNFIDVAFHIKNQGTDNENFHCHVLEGRRTIDEQGNVGNALRLKKSHFDDLKWIREQLANEFNKALTGALKFTHLSNEEIVANALEVDDLALAIEKNYKPNTFKSKGYDSKFYPKRKSDFVKAITAKTKAIREEQKAKAEQYKQDKAELKALELQAASMRIELEKAEIYQNDLVLTAFTAAEIEDHLNNLDNQQRMFELKENIAAFEKDRKETQELYNLLLTGLDFDLMTLTHTPQLQFKSLADVKASFKKTMEVNHIKGDDVTKYKVDLLAYKIFTKPAYVEKMLYLQYQNFYFLKESKALASLKEKPEAELSPNEKAYLELLLNKEQISKNIFKNAVNDIDNFKAIIKEGYESHRDIFSEMEIRVKTKQTEKYIERNKDKIIKDKQDFLKREEFFNYIKTMKEVREEINKIKENDEMLKTSRNILKETMNEYNENFEKVLKLMNTNYFISDLKVNGIRQIYRIPKF